MQQSVWRGSSRLLRSAHRCRLPRVHPAQYRSVHRLIQNAGDDNIRIAEMIGWYRERGHMVASLDPLGRVERGVWQHETPGLAEPPSPDMVESLLLWLIERYPWDSSAAVRGNWLCGMLGLRADLADKSMPMPMLHAKVEGKPMWKIHELFEHLTNSYAGTLSCQFTHLNMEQQNWIMDKMENRFVMSGTYRRGILYDLLHTHLFETFLGANFPSSKRFGIEGCESFIPGMETVIRRSSELGVSDIFIGMAHRGRLAVLHTIMGKAMGAICCEMKERHSPFHVGDVKYHLGLQSVFAYNRTNRKRVDLANFPVDRLHEIQSINLHLCPNPSHLEAVNPVVLGITHAKQNLARDERRKCIMPLLIHGDASFSGLGIVHETLQLSLLQGYSVGGTVHLVINNQIGYTTTPGQARSSVHATDLAKTAQGPIFRANANDPEAVCEACMLAAEFRAEFGRDVVVDIVGYRRHGHNELDDPTSTQPITYDLASHTPSVFDVYHKRCVEDHVVTPERLESWKQNFLHKFQREHELALTGEYEQTPMDFVADTFKNTGVVEERRTAQESTGLPIESLQFIANNACDLSNVEFHLHPLVKQLMRKRLSMVENASSRVDWGMAEMLAFGSLTLHEDVGPLAMNPDISVSPLHYNHFRVRLSGQDSERGTFNQRHAAIYDRETAQRYVPLANIVPGGQDEFEVWNSPLNEGGVLGFEYGASLGYENNALVLWEAQFGDFANNAQTIIDQFIASGEERWNQNSRLVLLLPHGYDGQGPDHSSGRLERFLQLMNDDPDYLPGRDPNSRKLIEQTVEALGSDEYISKERVIELLYQCVEDPAERIETMWLEMCINPGEDRIPRSTWERFMTSFLRRHAERTANMIVLNCSTPAQYFHALRRQANLPYHKPMVIMAPKFLLHHKPCTSALSDFTPGTFFNRVITDLKDADNTRHLSHHPTTGERYLVDNEYVRRVILCSGQIYYKLSQQRRKHKIRDIALVRLEQIAPFPHDRIIEAISLFPNAEVVWCQEEPKNMGAWFYVQPRLMTALKEHYLSRGMDVVRPRYIGRPVSAATATASFGIHRDEEQALLMDATTVDA
ncbi:hypothetical protein PTSG_03534 [Salpingoeca rosetta]|uniref:Transketolase-like pyrimidine-binding domain-containing protein n=1 Tax=Salpingoeca rosetta (strain ATCC 50818 / BSB-021) TaxID=946362 RepID=F2U5W1_SALR5|nr:uncharacterized protein PTSG_03534 [Salpingoeca rosetta]EGD82902.1 hypothetical protein PTSG_03534 [Salpingoeca rosetta]|eukprot:XP_004995266.1 hypothetical protein PTSG_03534 [Salpingoeca rosetta]